MAENEGKGEVRRVLGRSFTNSGNEQPDNSNIEEQQVQPNTSSQTEQNNNGNENPSNDENLDDYISQILNTNVQNNEYIKAIDKFFISGSKYNKNYGKAYNELEL